MKGVYCLFIVFDTIVGVKEPNYGDVCLSLLHAGFKKKLSFWFIGCDIFVINEWNCEWYLLLYETCVV